MLTADRLRGGGRVRDLGRLGLDGGEHPAADTAVDAPDRGQTDGSSRGHDLRAGNLRSKMLSNTVSRTLSYPRCNVRHFEKILRPLFAPECSRWSKW